ncbi:hypothetical protein PVAP13_4NG288900 [Panicum virgatum]|uniref:Uncharacterized protein n=1 Tax=Panicum virgatum TaxID=38727 RepID=A0A8T0T9D7_PANVG|nr:hypothetical protein PVAP13_4NG288900 [Panicum virgatum]
MADHMWRTCPSSLRFPSGFSRLVRLSLLRVGSVSFGYPLSSDAFPALEVIHLRSARSVDLNRLLSRVYALARFGSATCLTKLRKLPSLRELQLLMFATASTNLAHIYMFLRTCRCPQLERLFVQLPTSRRDTFVGSSSEVVAEDEPAEVSEEDETEEELLKEEQVQKYVLEEKLFYEDVYEEDPLDENVPLEEQSEEDVPEFCIYREHLKQANICTKCRGGSPLPAYAQSQKPGHQARNSQRESTMLLKS